MKVQLGFYLFLNFNEYFLNSEGIKMVIFIQEVAGKRLYKPISD